MLVEIIVLVVGLAMAGLLMAAVAIAINRQGRQIADRIAQADGYLAKARRGREGSSQPAIVLAGGTKLAIRPAVRP